MVGVKLLRCGAVTNGSRECALEVVQRVQQTERRTRLTQGDTSSCRARALHRGGNLPIPRARRRLDQPNSACCAWACRQASTENPLVALSLLAEWAI